MSNYLWDDKIPMRVRRGRIFDTKAAKKKVETEDSVEEFEDIYSSSPEAELEPDPVAFNDEDVIDAIEKISEEDDLKGEAEEFPDSDMFYFVDEDDCDPIPVRNDLLINFMTEGEKDEYLSNLSDLNSLEDEAISLSEGSYQQSESIVADFNEALEKNECVHAQHLKEIEEEMADKIQAENKRHEAALKRIKNKRDKAQEALRGEISSREDDVAKRRKDLVEQIQHYEEAARKRQRRSGC